MEASAAGAAPHVPIYISSDDEDDCAILDAYYSPEEIQIQQAILLSVGSSRDPISIPPSSSSASASRSAVIDPHQEPAEEFPPDRKGKRKLSSEEDDTSDSKMRRKRGRFMCAICMENIQASEQFLVRHCAHAFCNDCVGQYVAAKVGESVAVIGCPDPGCAEGFVEMDQCRDIIPRELSDRWSVALCELALGNEKYYCPFKDCSALLIKDDDGTVEIRETECPHCRRLFCARCCVPWHDGVGCEELQELGEDERSREDVMLKQLAGRERWQRCLQCRMYVEKSEGCTFMRCRCGFCFCYSCASPLSSHYCERCTRNGNGVLS